MKIVKIVSIFYLIRKENDQILFPCHTRDIVFYLDVCTYNNTVHIAVCLAGHR